METSDWEEMNAIEIREPGGPEVLSPCQRKIPDIRTDEVLVKVLAAGVNRPDVMQRKGQYPPPPGASDIPGLEISGVITALGSEAQNLSIGMEICALVSGGGYAEFCTVPASLCMRIPKGTSIVEAAAIPETFFTVWDNVFKRGQLKPGETLLVHGGSSGIGTTAIQLAHAAGARVFVTAGSKEKCDACKALGADRAINYREEDFVEIISNATNGEGVDVILDMVGGDYVSKNLNCLSFGGRIVQIAIQRGTKAEIPVHLILVKQATLTGSTLRSRSIDEKAIIAAELKREVWPLIEKGVVKPQIFRTFDLKQASDAHRLMDSSSHIGKIVLTT
jgi:NADPH2:quinone reductase